MKNNQREILVYLDEGVTRLSFFQIVRSIKSHPSISLPVKPIRAEDLLQKEWEKTTALLIFPGGRDLPYQKKLKGEGNLRIRKYVEEGGRYLGICAGAYFASSIVQFEKGGKLEVEEERDLKFFPGKAVGPAYGPNQFSYSSQRGALAAQIDWGEEEILSIYYNGGCFFEEAEKHPDVSVIARFADIDSSPPAMIHCSFGKGQAILMGVHPEYQFQAFNKEDIYLKPHLPSLEKSEEARKRLFDFILSLILI